MHAANTWPEQNACSKPRSKRASPSPRLDADFHKIALQRGDVGEEARAHTCEIGLIIHTRPFTVGPQPSPRVWTKRRQAPPTKPHKSHAAILCVDFTHHRTTAHDTGSVLRLFTLHACDAHNVRRSLAATARMDHRYRLQAHTTTLAWGTLIYGASPRCLRKPPVG